MNRHLVYTRLWILTVLFAFLAIGLSAQSHSARETALLFVQENPSKFELTKNDVSDVKVVREYSTKHNGVTHVWLQQQYHGIPVFNGLFGLHVRPNGEVMHLGHRFVNDLSNRINTDLPSLSAAKALEMAMANLGFTGFPLPALRSKANEQNFVFEGGSISKKQIPVSASYLLTNSGSVRLSWEMVIDQANTPDLWTITVDAQTGMISNKLNHTVYCQAGHAHRGGGADQCSETTANGQQSKVNGQKSTVNSQQSTVNSQPSFAKASAGEQSAIDELLLDEKYNVFALPIESPTYGNRTIQTNPADPQASPFGWLDLDGVIGQDNTFTHGNNVWAFDDSVFDNTPDPSESADGGATLIFDFPFDPVAEPDANKQAAITNLFYINNKMHDIFYRYGFDEEAGNFQNNNYGHGGNANDEVFAQALDGPDTDNANFSTPADGGNGSMQMYVWKRKGIAVSVNGPGLVIGVYNGQSSDDTPIQPWGGIITDVPVTGDVVVTSDGTGAPTLGCNPPVIDVAGKIVMVDRSECEFGVKALNVQNAGGIACIICNFEDVDLSIGAGVVGGQVTIPTLIMHKVDCDLLRQYAGAGLNISINRPIPVPPAQRDGDFDNSVIMHEYHHGISTRLTGNGFDCLPNTQTHEQMGEGWSDWAALVNTVEPGDQGTDKRGIGNYALYKGNDGSGIRRYPYSTDMSIAPLTYGAVSSSVAPHGVGEVWANMVWDLYWAMVEKYGWDADINNTNSGNYRAIQLVVDGMKLQRCVPGFVDGRDAIMSADTMDYNAADACLISTVFARRGLGYLADQGDPANIGDGKENFDPIPICVKELKINKITTTPTVNPGDNVSFEITVTNHKDAAATNVVVTDELPSGLSLVSASNGGVLSGGMVRWDLGTMPSGQVTNLTYVAKSAAGIGSNRYFHDLLEDELDWYANLVDLTTGEIFTLQSAVVHPGSGTSAWAGKDVPIVSDYSLETTLHLTVTGSKPALRFWHQYETEAGVDAGFIEVQDKADPLMQWFRLSKDKALRGGYDGGVQYGTFAIPFLSGFSGNSNGWKQSYFDLSGYSGKDITFRFRFGSDANTAPATGAWYIDEVDVMDLFHYAGEACITADGGDHACATAPEYGVIVEPVKVGTDEPNKQSIQMLVQPNPADDMLHISLGKALEGQVIVSLVAADGRTVLNRTSQGLSLGQVLTLDVQNVPAGMYTVQLQSGTGNSVHKVVIR